MRRISPELYEAIVEAERATQRAHNLCYSNAGEHNAGYWLSVQLGKAQSILMHYVVKYARGSR